MQSFFAYFYFLLELLGLSCERGLVFGVDHLIGPLCSIFSPGEDNRDEVSAPDATFQAISASCEIEHKRNDETVLTRFVAMTGVVLIIYLFNYKETKDALFVHICFRRLHGLVHNTRGARGRGVAAVVIISDDGQLDSRT